MRITLLRCLVAVAESGSASGAAAALGVSQPTVTRQLQILESLVGEPLFERTKRPWVLTAAGERTVRMARATIRTVDAVGSGLETVLRGPARDVLHVGLAQTAGMLLGVPLARSALRNRAPDRQVEFRHADSKVLIGEVLDGVLDLALVDSSELTRHPELGVGPTYSFAIQVWVRAGHPLVVGPEESISLSAVFSYPMVAPYPPADADVVLRQVLPHGAGVTDSLAVISEDVPALARLAIESDCVLITAEPLVAEWVRTGALQAVRLDTPFSFSSRIRLAVSPVRDVPASVLGWVRTCVDEALVELGAVVSDVDGAGRLLLGEMD